MVSVLESVEWGGPALSLLSRCDDLDPDLPAVMHLRHTERPMKELASPENFAQVSTEQGKKAAYEFGTRLPLDRRYRFYHTYLERTKETAEEIKEGIVDNGGRADIIGSLPLSTIVNRERYDELGRREAELMPEVLGLFYKWVGGHYPPWVRLPSLEFSQRGASIVVDNLRSAEADVFDVYVSHDVFVAPFLLHWFGVQPSDWVSFLDGFMFQLGDERMHVYTKYGRREAYYPYWWSF